MGREEHCKPVSLACVGSARSVWTTLGLPQLTATCASWVYTAQAPGCSAGHCPKRALCFMHFPSLSCAGSGSQVLRKGTESVRHVFCALPRSKQLRWPGAWWAYCPRWAVCLNHLPGLAPRFPRCTGKALSQVCPVPPVGGWSLAATLLADVNRPGSQEDVVSNGEPAHSLVEDAISGAKIAPCLLAQAAAHLPPCLQWGDGLIRSQLALLQYPLSPFFCEWALD